MPADRTSKATSVQSSSMPSRKPVLDYLNVPKDAKQLMMTPPMGPLVPAGWARSHVEEAPMPEALTPFDLDAPIGMVSLGDGRYVDVEETRRLLEMEGERLGFRVTRRKIIAAKDEAVPKFIIDLYD